MNNLKAIYIAIPKCALTSILEALKNEKSVITEKSDIIKMNRPDANGFPFKLWEDIGTAMIMKHCINNDFLWSKAFKFAFVRNPFDRYVSNWKWLTRKEKAYPIKGWKARGWKGEDGQITFKDFISQIKYVDDISTDNYQHDRWHMLPQWKHIISSSELLVNFVGKFENLQDDFNYVCDTIGIEKQILPHLNYEGFYEGAENPINKKHYSEYYDDELIEIVSKMCIDDLKYFEYEFEDKRDCK